MTVSFFGHRDTPSEVAQILRETVIDLIENHGADIFYVGNHGAFDAMVKGVLCELKKEYPHVNYAVVLAYMPKNNTGQNFENTVFPEGLENTLPRYAIAARNRWMILRSELLVVYVSRNFGGAANAKKLAEIKKKRVINLFCTKKIRS